MKSKLKKSLSILLSILMLMSITAGLDFSAYAGNSGKCGKSVYYSYNSSTATLTINGKGAMYDYMNLYGDGNYSPFVEYENLKVVVINSGVTRIGECTFQEKTNLNNVVIPDTVKSIGDEAFYGCYKLNINVPSTVTSIGTGAFANVFNVNYSGKATGSPWSAISVNGYVDGNYVYSSKSKTVLRGYVGNIHKVAIPNSVKSIAQGAFDYGCDVAVPEGVETLNAISGNRADGLSMLNRLYVGKGVKKANISTSTSDFNVKYFYYLGTKSDYKKIFGNKITVYNKIYYLFTSLNSVSNNNNQIKATWDGVKGVTGYEVVYSKNKNFKDSKIVKVAKNKTSVNIKVPSGRYYVSIRTYKNFNGTLVHSKLSYSKSVVIK